LNISSLLAVAVLEVASAVVAVLEDIKPAR
jgi:hypothetical protein